MNKPLGRPRSAQARSAVLHAVDDLLVEVGYAAMTMKGIAERAGVGRQTVYRWWSTKAEILFEASVIDGRQELAVDPTGDPTRDLTAFLDALSIFLTRSAAGAAYRALLGEAQHDQAVATLVAGQDVVSEGAEAVLRGAFPARPWRSGELGYVVARLAGPVVFRILGGHDPGSLDIGRLVADCVAATR